MLPVTDVHTAVDADPPVVQMYKIPRASSNTLSPAPPPSTPVGGSLRIVKFVAPFVPGLMIMQYFPCAA